MATAEILSDYIPRKQLAAELGLAEATLIRWEKDGRGPPCTRVGRDPLYYKPSIEKWLRSCERAKPRASAA